MKHAVVGRDREIAQLELSIGAGRDGLRIAMLSGPSGLGKTTVSGIAIERAAARGFRAIPIHGRAGSLSVPFQPFCEVFPEFQAFLTSAEDTGVVMDVERAGVGLVRLVTEISLDAPVLLVFDDAQALDESSIALLPYLTGISEQTNVSLLFIEQTDAIDVPSSYRAFVDGMVARSVVGHLPLQVLADASIRTIAASVLGAADEADVPSTIVERAQGNPWFAIELATCHRDGVDELPSTIAAAATSRLSALTETGQDLVLVTALCPDGAHIAWLEALSGESPRSFVRLMEVLSSTGLLREDGDIVTIAHPLMRQALQVDLSAARRRALHTEVAAIAEHAQLGEVGTARVRGHHLRLAGRPLDAALEFRRAAELNEGALRPHEAYADLMHALEASDRNEERVELLRRCASLAMQVDRRGAEKYWIELGRNAAVTGDDESYAHALFQQYWSCNDGAARDRLERAVALGVERYGWSARAGANIASLEGNFDEAERLDRLALEHAERNDDDFLRALATHRIGIALFYTGRGVEAITMLRAAVHLSMKHRFHGWAILAWADLIDVLSAELRSVDAIVESTSMSSYVEELGLERYQSLALAERANALLRSGDVEGASQASAMATARAATSRDVQFTPLVALIHAECALDANDSGAPAAVAAAVEVARRAGNESWADLLQVMTIRVQSTATDLASTIRDITDAMESTPEMQVRAEALCWLVRTAAMHGDAAALDSIRGLSPLLEPDVAYVNLVIDEVKAMFAAHDEGSIEALVAVARCWSDGGRMLDAARSIAAAGAIQLRRGDAPGAQERLLDAKEQLLRCGASGDVDRVAALLRQCGTRSRARSSSTTVGPLTKRELEVARLVAGGHRNSDVAASLFLAEKTVAAHLSNIYGKVEVRSRVQLGAWIREHDPEYVAT